MDRKKLLVGPFSVRRPYFPDPCVVVRNGLFYKRSFASCKLPVNRDSYSCIVTYEIMNEVLKRMIITILSIHVIKRVQEINLSFSKLQTIVAFLYRCFMHTRA